MRKNYKVSIIVAVGFVAALGFFVVGFDQGHILSIIYGNQAFPELYIHELTHDMRHAVGFGCNEICPDLQEIIADEYSKDKFNFSKLIRNEENQYCASTNEEQSDYCYSLEDIVFGNARKSWTVYPGGAGWQIPRTSTLEPIYKEVNIGMRSLNFTAMLDDKIFVNKCESNGGVWNYTYHDCEGLWNVCSEIGGINIQEDITPPCTDTGILDDDLLTIKVCRGPTTIRVSCVFENEN